MSFTSRNAPVWGTGVIFRTDLAQLAKRIHGMARELPRAAVMALNDTAWLVEAGLRTRLMPSVFDRPTPFTLNAFRVQPGTPARPAAEIVLKDQQLAAGYAELFTLEEKGGTRRPKGRAHVLPRAVALDQHGNMPRGLVRRLAGRKDVFVGKIGGRGGVWQRQGRRVKMLVAFKGATKYRARFPFQRFVATETARILPGRIGPAMERAMRMPGR